MPVPTSHTSSAIWQIQPTWGSAVGERTNEENRVHIWCRAGMWGTPSIAPFRHFDERWPYKVQSWKIIHSMAANANTHNIYIGLTHKDISCSIHGKKDWGVQGLSLIPGNACVASTFRVKDRRDFWKVVCHEFIHTYFTYNHCPKDDPSCLMQAAKGHPRYKGKNGLCPHCSSVLKI